MNIQNINNIFYKLKKPVLFCKIKQAFDIKIEINYSKLK